METMIRTITVKGRIYTVEDEPTLGGEIAPHLYNSRGECVGHAVMLDGKPWMVGTPSRWSGADIRSAVAQLTE